MSSHPETSSTENIQDLSARAVSRLDNLKSALDWISSKIQSDAAYAENFSYFTKILKQRRYRVEVDCFSQVHLCAIGKSGDVAKLLTSMLTSVGIRASFLHPTEAMHGDLGSVFQSDSVLFISNRGESSELLELVPLIKNRQAEVLCLTAHSDSPLAQQSHHALLLPRVNEMCAHNHAPTTSTVVALALGQLLVAASMDDGQLDFESYAQNHPGGAIGKRIFVKVTDIMFKGDKLPIIEENTSFSDTISAMTEKALGAVFVVAENKLQGIITEKDLRQAMKKFGPDIFNRLPVEYMNHTPITIQEDALAIDALRQMELRKNPLNFLPVVNSQNSPSGLVRLHDLIQAGIRL